MQSPDTDEALLGPQCEALLGPVALEPKWRGPSLRATGQWGHADSTAELSTQRGVNVSAAVDEAVVVVAQPYEAAQPAVGQRGGPVSHGRDLA